MSTVYTWQSGGLRYIADAVVADDQPYSVALQGSLAHTQHLIDRTLTPRTLINDMWPQNNGGADPTIEVTGYGRMLAAWPRLPYRSAMELVSKIHAAKITSRATLLHLLSSPSLYTGNEVLSELIGSAAEDDHYATLDISSTSYQWWSFAEIFPGSSDEQWHYLTLWGAADGDVTDTSQLKITGISIRERRRSTL